MRQVQIEEVATNASGQLLVRPVLNSKESFALVYRAAMGVNWDPRERALATPSPNDWTHFEWFKQVVAAVANEYGQQLVLQPSTRWRGVATDIRARIETWAQGGPTTG